MVDCLFCKIIKGEIPAQKVYEDEYVFAFLTIRPVNIGHTLIVPKKHAANIYETSDEDLAHLAKVAKKLSHTIREAVGAGGINIVTNNDSPAGQVIFHTHWHIIPRFSNDGLKHWDSARDYSEKELGETAEKIRTLL